MVLNPDYIMAFIVNNRINLIRRAFQCCLVSLESFVNYSTLIRPDEVPWLFEVRHVLSFDFRFYFEPSSNLLICLVHLFNVFTSCLPFWLINPESYDVISDQIKPEGSQRHLLLLIYGLKYIMLSLAMSLASFNSLF